MNSDHNDDLESPDPMERGVGESETDEDLPENDDVVMPETNEAEAEDEDPEEEDLNSPSTSSFAMVSTISTSAVVPVTHTTDFSTDTVTVALPAGSAVPVSVIPVDSDPKWPHMTEIVHQRPPIDDCRRLFQRLWTDEDEIELLRGFLDYMTTHRGSSSHPPDTAPFYENIKSKLQLDFNKNQLVEKLRRLKKKYRNAMNKISSGKEVFFKSPHDQSTFEISRKIWNQTGKIIGFEDNNNGMDLEETNNTNGTNNYSTFNSPSSNPTTHELDSENGVETKLTMSSSSGSRKRSRSRIGKIEEDNNIKPIITPSDGKIPNNVNLNETAATVGVNLGGLMEETVKNCVSPVIKDIMNGTTSMMMASMGGGAHGFGSLSPPMFTRPLNFGFGEGGNKTVMDERWRKQQILELEVYSRRLDLVQEQIRTRLNELKTMQSGV